MAADGDLSYGSYQDILSLLMQYINISFLEQKFAKVNMSMDSNHQRASNQNLRVNEWTPRYCNNKGQQLKNQFNDPLEQGIELFQIQFFQ